MSRKGDVTLPFGDGEYVFRLGVEEWRRIDEKCHVGPQELFNRLVNDRWRADEIIEVHRLGLEGGRSVVTAAGVPDMIRINRLVRDYVTNELAFLGKRRGDGTVDISTSSKMRALLICDAALIAPADDVLPKSAAEESVHPSSLTGGSPSRQSMDGDQFSDYPRGTSTSSASGNSLPHKLDG